MLITRRHTIIAIACIAIAAIAAALVFINRSSARAFINRVELNQAQYVAGDVVTLTAFFDNWEMMQSAAVAIDGAVVTTCVPAPTCVYSYTLDTTDVGTHSYVVHGVSARGKTVQASGTFAVQKDVPEFVSVVANHSIAVGGGLYVYAQTKSASPITATKLFVDGALKQYCVSSCVGYVGPFAAQDTGNHTYTLEVVNAAGETAMSFGTFTVAQGTGSAAVTNITVPSITSMTLGSAQLTEGDTTSVTVQAMDDTGVAAILLYVDGKALAACKDKTVCSATLGPFLTTEAGAHVVHAVVVNAAGQKAEAEKSFSVIKKASSPVQPTVPAQMEQPPAVIPPPPVSNNNNVPAQQQADASSVPQVVNLTANATVTEGQDYTFSITVKDTVAISKIIAFADGKAVQTCVNATVCTATLLSSQLIVGQHTYSFFVVNAQNKTIEPQGAFTVIKKPEPAAPVILSLAVNAASVTQGETFSFGTVVKDEVGIDKVNMLVDGNIIKACVGALVCNATMPMTVVGDHTYKVEVFSLSGKSSSKEGKMTVVVPPAPKFVSYKLSNITIYQPEMAQVSATFSDAKPLAKIEIRVDGKYLNDCTATYTCVVFTEFLEVGIHPIEFIGTSVNGQIATGKASLRVLKGPNPNGFDVIYGYDGPALVAPGESVLFKVKGESTAGIKNIWLYFSDGKTAKQLRHCSNSDTCQASFVPDHNDFLTAVFEDGSGYFLKDRHLISIGVLP